jgi:hypothetical protein
VLAVAIALASTTASAQQEATLTISGTFNMDETWGSAIGDDLLEVFANENEHWWTLTLYGVAYSHDFDYFEWDDGDGVGYDEQYITRVHAASFDFEFFGPDADVLNQVLSEQLVRGGLADGAFLELRNGNLFDPVDLLGGGPYAGWHLALAPLDVNSGVSFSAGHLWLPYPEYPYRFSTDENGYPVVEPQCVLSERTSISDFRPGNAGALASVNDLVDIGSDGPPLPPPPPTLNIQDREVREGNRGTTRLTLTLTLSRSSSNVVTVSYSTANGTALANKDYLAASGVLTFQPGQTSRTITVFIRTDRKREPNEAFYVQLAGAAGATIDDAAATVTILNDD